MQVLQLQDVLGIGSCATRTLVCSVAMFNVTDLALSPSNNGIGGPLLHHMLDLC